MHHSTGFAGASLPPPPGPDWQAPPPVLMHRASRWSGGVIAAIVAGGVGLLLLGMAVGAGLMYVAGPLPPPPEPLTYGPGGVIAQFDLEVGACADGSPIDGGMWTSADAVPCDALHDFEVYAATEAPAEAGEHYPGAEELSLFAAGYCEVLFEPYTGEDYWESFLDYLPLVPSEGAWGAGARTVACALVAMDGSPLGDDLATW